MNKLLEMVSRDDNCLSLGRVMAILVFVMWVFITLWTLFRACIYPHYDYLTYLVCFMTGGVICGKWVDGRNMAIRDNSTIVINRGEPK